MAHSKNVNCVIGGMINNSPNYGSQIVGSAIGSGNLVTYFSNGASTVQFGNHKIEDVSKFKLIALDKFDKEIENFNIPPGTSIHIDVTAPNTIIQQISTISAEVNVSKCKSVSSVSTQSGDVTVQTKSISTINTINGDVKVKDTSQIRTITTVSGDMELTCTQQPQISTVSGKIRHSKKRKQST
jgi:DUF4097 and DUF4098 domain-containing protein YvlB